MTAHDVIAVDFETQPIRKRPAYPPLPAGASIKWPDQPSRYYACSHPSGNNATTREAQAALEEAWASPLPKLFHYAKFDMAVAHERLGLPLLAPDQFEDTMFLAFLLDPHARSLELKPLAEDLLGWAPEERDVVRDWLWDHRQQLRASFGVNIVSRKQRDMGAYISYAPGGVVGPYAEGDTDRTAALFKFLYPIIVKEGMLAAYRREKRVQPIFMANERRGLRIDMDGLERDVAGYRDDLRLVEEWMRRELKASGLNFDADRDVANVLLQRGIVHEDDFSLTKTGQLSMKKDVLLPSMFTDSRIASALGYRNRLVTCVNTFMGSWLEEGTQSGGRIHTTWNQVRGASGGGTRTGRPSCTDPNLLNLAKNFEEEKRAATDGYVHPDFLPVERLPLVRKYVLPEIGHTWLHRDFDGQELRVFAHYEEGELFDAYREDPRTDPHAYVGAKVVELAGIDYPRTIVKNINFGKIYGAGIPRIMELLRCTRREAQQFDAIHEKAMPGRKVLSDALKELARRRDPLVTWGGRCYYCEEPRVIDGRRRTFEYKMLNYLIQPSAADITKQTMIDWDDATDGGANFQCQVYDELNLSAPVEDAARYMRELKDVMELPRLDVPMLSSGKQGPTWGDLEKCE